MNHTLSDSQLEEMIKSAVNSSGPLPPDEKFSQLISALRELQEHRKAAMDTEPVGWTDEAELRDVEKDGCGYLFKANPISPHADPRRVIKLYRHAQPAQVVPEEATPDSIEILASGRCRDHVVYQWDEDQRNAAADSWNACRAAMLHAGNSPAQSDCCPAQNSVVPAQICSSPAIPDGYVMVPAEPNGDMLAAAQDAYGETDGDIASTLRAAMLAAAPQELKK